MSDPLPAPNFNIGFTVAPTDIGSGYAKGITAAGESLAKAIGSVSDIAKQNVDTNDTLTALHQNKILTDDEYNSVMNKSLGAKQTMLGMYAGQYLANQAAAREMAKQTGAGQVDINVAHAKLLDTIQAVKSGYGLAAGVNTGKLPITPQQQAAQVAQAAGTGSLTAPTTPPQGGPGLNYIGGVRGAPLPLGSGNIYNPPASAAPPPTTRLTIGPPMGKEPIPLGANLKTVKGQQGYLLPDGVTFRPLQ
jgi:hypothetical protein